MKNRFILLLALVQILTVFSCAKKDDMPFLSTYKIEEGDTEDIIIKKAAHVVPTANQLNALKNEFIAFIHIGPNTFTRMEWGNGMEDPKIFDLKELDTDQWCEAMSAAGMKMVIITVKHHDGFVLWQSRYTDHGIMSTNFRGGKGDILKDLSESCQKYGLKLGVYLSPADLYQIEHPDGLYGNLSQYTKRTIPREVEGRPFANKTTFEFEVDDYNEYFLNQLFEILTEYGPVHEVWFDGAHPKTKGGQKYNYQAWKKLIKTLAPEAVVFGKEEVRWCGNEAGATRATEWNVIPYPMDPDTATMFPDRMAEELGSREKLLEEGMNYLHYQQAETNTSIREGWFYRDDTHQKVRSADDVFDMYERSVGGNSTFLLNIPPNREGKFSPRDVETLVETGKRIRATYTDNLLKGAKGPKEILDDNYETSTLLKGKNPEVTITTPEAITLNRLVIQEAIATNGERVEEHALDAWIDGQWQEIVQATNIGYKRILRFPEVTTNKLRIRVLESRLEPAFCNISAHYYKSTPPQLTASRNNEGLVTIEPLLQDFGWKPHGENASKNLTQGIKIYYTTDSKEPNENSTEYTAPFSIGSANIKAVAIINGEKGAVMEQQIGFAKKVWKLIDVSDKSSKEKAQLAFDENPATHWESKGSQNSITIDLGQIENMAGFAYTPSKKYNKSMMSKGNIQVSNDNSKWSNVGTFVFGNLINDPSKRYFHFNKPVSGRYVRVIATESADHSNVVTIGELDFF